MSSTEGPSEPIPTTPESPEAEPSLAPEAFKQELTSVEDTLRGIAFKLTGNAATAEDMVQTTHLKALKNWKQYKEGTSLLAWTSMILRNTYFSLLRKQKREVPDIDGKIGLSIATEGNQRSRDDLEHVQKMFAFLPSGCQEPLLLVASGMTYEDIASTLKRPMATIKAQINRARVFLRAAQFVAEGLSDDEILRILDSKDTSTLPTLVRRARAAVDSLAIEKRHTT